MQRDNLHLWWGIMSKTTELTEWSMPDWNEHCHALNEFNISAKHANQLTCKGRNRQRAQLTRAFHCTVDWSKTGIEKLDWNLRMTLSAGNYTALGAICDQR